jgi:hypothetical protein
VRAMPADNANQHLQTAMQSDLLPALSNRIASLRLQMRQRHSSPARLHLAVFSHRQLHALTNWINAIFNERSSVINN